jgi:hypothetical protein
LSSYSPILSPFYFDISGNGWDQTHGLLNTRLVS